MSGRNGNPTRGGTKTTGENSIGAAGASQLKAGAERVSDLAAGGRAVRTVGTTAAAAMRDTPASRTMDFMGTRYGYGLKVQAKCAALGLFLALAAHAEQSVTLAWDPSPDPEVTGAIVYYGNASRNYPYHTNVGNVTRATVNGLEAGLTYYFAVTATNSAGLESDYSNEVSTSIPSDLTNSFPTVSQVGGMVMREDTTTNCTVIVWDTETPAGNLTVTASSANSDLLPADRLTVSGTNHNRTVTLSPAPNAFGQTLVTICVSDGMKTASTSFVLTVLDVPEPIRTLTVFSGLESAPSPDGPWSDVLATYLPIVCDTNRFYRMKLNFKPPNK
jgi:hypothetical protein